ncbi:MAG TPA: hypothetical protein VF554_16965, partial [Thermoanaerobaculia bacterium]
GRLTNTRPADPGVRRLAGRPTLKASVALLSLYARASGRYREAAAAWDDAVERGFGAHGTGAPFSDALVPPPEAFPSAPDGRAPVRKRRRGGRRRKPQAPAAPA